MLAKTFSISFRLKKPINYESGPQSIYLRITVSKKRVEISTQRECDPIKWNASVGHARGTNEDSKILNAFLSSMQQKVYEAHRSLMDNSETITAEKIKNKLLGIAERPKMILEISVLGNFFWSKSFRSGTY